VRKMIIFPGNETYDSSKKSQREIREKEKG